MNPTEILRSVSIPDLLPEGRIGVATISHFEVSPMESAFTGMRAAAHGAHELVRPGKYARLEVRGTLMMTDTSMERNTNMEFVRKAKGHVLIAGLGIGLILHAIKDKPEVTHITVIEKYVDVIALVGPSIREIYGDRLTIIAADIFEWKPEKGTRFDCIYMDIWPSLSLDVLKEMGRLHRRFGQYKSPGAWMGSWRHDDLKSRRAALARQGGGFWGRPR